MSDLDTQILTLKMELDGSRSKVASWTRVVEIPANFSFYELHCAIQDLINFDDDHMYEFFVGSRWDRPIEQIEEAATPDEPGEYENRLLSSVFPLQKGQKLYYWFDFRSDWIISMICTKSTGVVNKRAKYPRVVEKRGRNPSQYRY